MDYEAHIDRLIEVGKQIEPGKFTILTGGNGRGKSFIRKLLHQFLGQKTDEKINIGEVSLDARAGIHTHGFDMFNRDIDWLPSSTQSFEHCEDLINAKSKCFMVFDEPEIGMSEEFQAALGEYFNKVKADALKNGHGILLITHSRVITKIVQEDCFLNIEGMSKDEWVNREVVPLDIEQLREESNGLMRAIQPRLKATD